MEEELQILVLVLVQVVVLAAGVQKLVDQVVLEHLVKEMMVEMDREDLVEGVVVVPGAGHGGGGAHGDRRRKDFFRKHLLGLKPPERNAPQ